MTRKFARRSGKIQRRRARGPATSQTQVPEFHAPTPAEQMMAKLEPGDGLRGPDHLVGTTGKTMGYWLVAVEQAIRACEKPLSAKVAKRLGISPVGHADCDPRAVVTRLADMVFKCTPELVDGNMFMCQTLGLILVAWAVRIGRAKAYDPNRPLKLRRYALERWMKFARELGNVAIDERYDHEAWSGQNWDPPFRPGAKDGSFL